MITRIVKLTIKDSNIEDFINLTNKEKKTIARSKGCQGLSIFNDNKYKNVFFSISKWDSEQDLNNYRNSDFFQQTWHQVKQWFAARPEAYSTNET